MSFWVFRVTSQTKLKNWLRFAPHRLGLFIVEVMGNTSNCQKDHFLVFLDFFSKPFALQSAMNED